MMMQPRNVLHAKLPGQGLKTLLESKMPPLPPRHQMVQELVPVASPLEVQVDPLVLVVFPLVGLPPEHLLQVVARSPQALVLGQLLGHPEESHLVLRQSLQAVPTLEAFHSA